jgi:hypothetical protein
LANFLVEFHENTLKLILRTIPRLFSALGNSHFDTRKKYCQVLSSPNLSCFNAFVSAIRDGFSLYGLVVFYFCWFRKGCTLELITTFYHEDFRLHISCLCSWNLMAINLWLGQPIWNLQFVVLSIKSLNAHRKLSYRSNKEAILTPQNLLSESSVESRYRTGSQIRIVNASPLPENCEMRSSQHWVKLSRQLRRGSSNLETFCHFVSNFHWNIMKITMETAVMFTLKFDLKNRSISTFIVMTFASPTMICPFVALSWKKHLFRSAFTIPSVSYFPSAPL